MRLARLALLGATLPFLLMACSAILGVEPGVLDPSTCSNGVKDPGETGVDCGGLCSACGNGGGLPSSSSSTNATGTSSASSSTSAGGASASGAGGVSSSSVGGVSSTGPGSVSSSSSGGASSSGAGGVSSSGAGGVSSSGPGGVSSSGAGGADAGADATTPLCGDNIIDVGEECDDGNSVPDDGCTNCVVDCPAPGFKEPATHHCYREVSSKKWSAANADCLITPLGYFAAITSAEELAFVAGHITPPVWIGGNDLITSGVWQWTDGEPWNFAPWLSGVPVVENGHCVSLEGSPLGINDVDCNVKQAYLCEVSPVGK